MRALTLILVSLLASGCAHTDAWSRQDTVLQLAYTSVVVLDAVQTSEIQYRADLVETGPVALHVLGASPSTSDTWQYFTTVAIGNWLIARALPRKWRTIWQGASLAYHVPVVVNNCKHDLPCIGD
jgi:hypothetical protein